MKVTLLISGKLGLECLNSIPAEYKLVSVFTDKGSEAIIKRVQEMGVPLFTGNPRDGRATSFINSQEKPDILFSVNYLFLIEKDLIQWPLTAALNIHGSLLPRYRGRTPHVWAIINNESETGATVHLVDEQCDTGAIILQKKFSILPEMTGAEVLNKFIGLYPEMIREALQMAASGKMNPTPQKHELATYFGKRTPDDGAINWNWQKERIKNWVRAQAHPYPGAFTWYKGNKLIIHRISYSDLGFDDNDINGMLLDSNRQHPVIKTPNGAVKLEEFEIMENTLFEKGAICTYQISG
jgi:methionyl-tRNA formyltransferase